MARALTTRTLSTITKQITATISASASRGYTSNIPFEFPPDVKETTTVEQIPNCSMKRGPAPEKFSDFWYTDKGVFGWTLMPGVPKENVSIKVIGNEIAYSGNENPYFPGLPDALVRSFETKIAVNPNKFDASRVKAELVNGLLWTHVPAISYA